MFGSGAFQLNSLFFTRKFCIIFRFVVRAAQLPYRDHYATTFSGHGTSAKGVEALISAK